MSHITANAPIINPESPVIRGYADYLVAIHQALASGDEEAADRLCEAADPIADKLTVNEVRWTSFLSEDLYSLSDGETLTPTHLSIDEWQAEISQAFSESNFNRMMTLLRMEVEIAPDRRAVMRSIAYQAIGLHSVSVEFMRHAIRIQPEIVDYKVFLLNRLYTAELYDDMAYTASQILGLLMPIRSRLFCGVLCHGAAFKARNDTRMSFFVYSKKFLEPIASGYSVHLLGQADLVMLFSLLGVAHLRIGEMKDAISRLDRAVLYSHNNADMVALRGLAYYEAGDTVRGIADLSQAVEYNTTATAAYLILAGLAIGDQHFLRSESLLTKILDFEMSPQLKSHTLEMLAISRLALNRPSTSVLDAIEEARLLRPNDDSLERNYARIIANVQGIGTLRSMRFLADFESLTHLSEKLTIADPTPMAATRWREQHSQGMGRGAFAAGSIAAR